MFKIIAKKEIDSVIGGCGYKPMKPMKPSCGGSSSGQVCTIDSETGVETCTPGSSSGGSSWGCKSMC